MEKETLFYLYDMHEPEGEEEKTLVTLDGAKEFLVGFWWNNPNEDQTEQDLEQLEKAILNSDESELFNRLAGVGYTIEEVEEVNT